MTKECRQQGHDLRKMISYDDWGPYPVLFCIDCGAELIVPMCVACDGHEWDEPTSPDPHDPDYYSKCTKCHEIRDRKPIDWEPFDHADEPREYQYTYDTMCK